ncbi:MAG: mechanosensitive ion channel [Deltaproteobacteria bacterium]|nr:mechanosensitive ion channel [Deltaproteobacteria bacterium]
MFQSTIQWLSVNSALPLFSFGGTQVTARSLGWLIIAIVVSWLISKLVQRAMGRAFRRQGVIGEGSMAAAARLVHYTVMVVGTSIGLEWIGVDLAALFAAGAVFAVAIGFAMQNLVQNFVSGIILLAERVIKPGDALELEGKLVRVVEPGIRSTIVRSADDEEIIVPNGNLVQGTVVNLTMRDSRLRVRGAVGVAYASDLDQVRAALDRAARTIEGRVKELEPVVFLTGFGSSSVDFEVSIWIDDPWFRQAFRSQLLFAIWNALKEDGIVIAFPQVDVHLDPPVAEGLAAGALRPAS